MNQNPPSSPAQPFLALVSVGLICLLGPLTTGHAVTWRADQNGVNYEAMANNTGGFTAGAVWPDLTPIGWLWDFSGPGLRGSATLVAPNWILTAGHVLKLNQSATYTLDNMWFYLGSNTGANYAQARVVEAIIFPSWTQNYNYFEGVDVALLRIDSNLGSTYGHATVASTKPALGARVVGGGYGIGGDGTTGGTVGIGVKRAMENTIDRNPSNLTVANSSVSGGLLLTDFDSPTENTTATNTLNQTWGAPYGPGTSSAAPLTFEGSLSPGDSGGSMFYFDADEWKLAGVNSFVSSVGPGGLSAGYGTISGMVNVANHYDWITSTIAIPEPGTVMLVILAGLFGIGALKFRSSG